AVVIGGSFQDPNGPTSRGETVVGLESRDGLVYRLRVKAGQTFLYQIQPGVYHLAPVRTVFGSPGKFLSADIDGRPYRTPFPLELANSGEFKAEPGGILVLGVLKVALSPALPDRGPLLSVSLDDYVADKRTMVQNLIQSMMNPAVSSELRRNTQAWLNPLQKILISLAAQPQTPLDQNP
ncbi:MAG: hypothetical protein KGL04_07850, partial [Elusimicrobia bacterium]|nr:hypothetical protein [Elusimicrobiota bacterium]